MPVAKHWLKRPDICGGFFEIADKEERLKSLEKEMTQSVFWSRGDESQKVLMEAKGIKKLLATWKELADEIEELK